MRSFLSALLRKSGTAASNASIARSTSIQKAKSLVPSVVVGTEAIESSVNASLTVTSERQSDSTNAANNEKKQEEDQSLEENGDSEEVALLHAAYAKPQHDSVSTTT
jgi:hypothetical protein